MELVKIEKMVHGGQGLGILSDGRKVFVWNALPGEVVQARIIKKKRSYAEAIAEEIVEASPQRIAPSEDNYLSTSPWQMMTYAAENTHKYDIVAELFAHEHITFPELSPVMHDDNYWHYRNKMEYSFWGDDDGLHLALHRRGSHGKQIVEGSKLAMPQLDQAAQSTLGSLQKLGVRASVLKTMIVRTSQAGVAAVSIFVKDRNFSDIVLPDNVAGMKVFYSDPRSPASVPTELLYEYGQTQLEDTVLGHPFVYDVDAFFQVNIPMYEQALAEIKTHINTPEVVDMYAGVGSIGLSVAAQHVDLVELDAVTAEMARINAAARAGELGSVRVIEASTEKALEYIVAHKPVIFDPPRAGLHPKVVERTLEAMPPQVIYLSCNPATQARDLARLQAGYAIETVKVFNFFPRTPHIEALAVLRRK